MKRDLRAERIAAWLHTKCDRRTRSHHTWWTHMGDARELIDVIRTRPDRMAVLDADIRACRICGNRSARPLCPECVELPITEICRCVRDTDKCGWIERQQLASTGNTWK